MKGDGMDGMSEREIRTETELRKLLEDAELFYAAGQYLFGLRAVGGLICRVCGTPAELPWTQGPPSLRALLEATRDHVCVQAPETTREERRDG